jgi:hypothetical protein
MHPEASVGTSMSQVFGRELPVPHVDAPHRPAARLLVLIDAGGVTVARLFLESRQPVAEFDAGSEEIAVMTRGLSPTQGADAPEWDKALSGHTPKERRAAAVYRLDV